MTSLKNAVLTAITAAALLLSLSACEKKEVVVASNKIEPRNVKDKIDQPLSKPKEIAVVKKERPLNNKRTE